MHNYNTELPKPEIPWRSQLCKGQTSQNSPMNSYSFQLYHHSGVVQQKCFRKRHHFMNFVSNFCSYLLYHQAKFEGSHGKQASAGVKESFILIQDRRRRKECVYETLYLLFFTSWHITSIATQLIFQPRTQPLLQKRGPGISYSCLIKLAQRPSHSTSTYFLSCLDQ